MDNKDIYSKPITDHGGSKYLRLIYPANGVGEPILVDVYSVIEAFNVTCPGLQHAIKKLLCTGLRGKGSKIDDIKGIFDAMWRAYELQKIREIEPEINKPKEELKTTLLGKCKFCSGPCAWDRDYCGCIDPKEYS